MADSIADNRTVLDTAEATTNYDDLAGAASGSVDVDTLIKGSGSISTFVSNTAVAGLLIDNGSAVDRSNTVVYMWVNFAAAGLMAVKASGGLAMRFCGATVTDWFEVYLEGSDTYSGGWKMFVVDIDEAKTASDGTNGTPPATTAIRYIGITANIGGMPKMQDNLFIDHSWLLASTGVPALIVEGQAAASTPWTWDDIVLANDPGDTTKALGVVDRLSNGTITVRGPIQFGLADADVDEFIDTAGENVAFEFQDNIPDDFYVLSGVFGTGTSTVRIGTRVGTGDPAVGVGGGSISSGGPRWVLDFEDADNDAIEFLGVAISGGGQFSVAQQAVEFRSCVFDNVDTIAHNNGLQLIHCFFNNAPGIGPQIDLLSAPADGDFEDLLFTNMSDFAIEISENGPVTYTMRNIRFSGNGASGDVEYTHASGLVTYANADGGDVPGVTQTGAGTNETTTAVTIRVQGVTEGAAIVMIADETVGDVTAGDVILQGLADSTGALQDAAFNYQGDINVTIRVRQQGIPNAAIQDDNGAFTDQTSESNSSTTNDMDLLPVAEVAGQDRYVFGHAEEFGQLRLDVSTASDGGTIVWQYWNGAWTNLSGVTDGTNGFQNTGPNVVSWTIPGDWVATTINSQGPFKFVRAALTAGSTTVQPQGRKCKLDVLRYLPFTQSNTIQSTGLTVIAAWNRDTISTF